MILLWKVPKEKPCIRLAVSISKYLDFRPLFTQVERGAGGEYMKFKEGLQLVSLAVILLGVLNKSKQSGEPDRSVERKSPCRFIGKGFLFVDKRFEISYH
jgi:hypothetical protein